MEPSAAMDLDARAGTVGDALRGEPAVVFAYLFGSRARGTAGPRSDIDVAVYLAGDVDTFNMRLALMGRLSALLGTDALDLIVLNDAPLALTGRIVESRRVVLDREPAVRHTFESLTARMFNDFRIRERRLLAARYPGG
jgi:predicted nucleotidyltransferase